MFGKRHQAKMTEEAPSSRPPGLLDELTIRWHLETDEQPELRELLNEQLGTSWIHASRLGDVVIATWPYNPGYDDPRHSFAYFCVLYHLQAQDGKYQLTKLLHEFKTLTHDLHTDADCARAPQWNVIWPTITDTLTPQQLQSVGQEAVVIGILVERINELTQELWDECAQQRAIEHELRQQWRQAMHQQYERDVARDINQRVLEATGSAIQEGEYVVDLNVGMIGSPMCRVRKWHEDGLEEVQLVPSEYVPYGLPSDMEPESVQEFIDKAAGKYGKMNDALVHCFKMYGEGYIVSVAPSPRIES